MTEPRQDQIKAEQQQNQATELDETQLEHAQGGIIDGSSNRAGTAKGGGTAGIKDGLSH